MMEKNKVNCVKSLHKDGFRLIDQAISNEERKGPIEKSIQLYNEGIKKFSQGIRISTDEKHKGIVDVQDKMKRNMKLAKERVKYLRDQMKTMHSAGSVCPNTDGSKEKPTKIDPSKLRNVDTELAKRILDEVMDTNTGVSFSGVIGNDLAKKHLMETAILPCKRPDLFVGLRRPVKGILLFGPPGNGKTMLAKALAQESGCHFFNISAATLFSKWVGEGEKLVRAMFAMAREIQPSIIFIDEIDCLLKSRSSDSKENTVRLVNQFLSEFDGVASAQNDRILLLGATNRPDELDDAALRRFPKRLYIGMPDENARLILLKHILKDIKHSLSFEHLNILARKTCLYSNSDLTQLCMDAAMNPLRELSTEEILTMDCGSERSVNMNDFLISLKKIRPSLSKEVLHKLQQWNAEYGDVSVSSEY